jgi:hypothetical protein
MKLVSAAIWLSPSVEGATTGNGGGVFDCG